MLRIARPSALLCLVSAAVSMFPLRALAQSPCEEFPFDILDVDDASGAIALAPRSETIARLTKLERVRLTGARLADGTVIDLELSRVDLSRRSFGIEVDGSPAPELLDELDLSLWTTVGRGSDEAMLSFSNHGCRGWIRHASVLHHLIPSPDASGDWSRSQAVLTDEGALAARGVTPTVACATDSLAAAALAARAAPVAPAALASASSASLYHARIALETDYQLFTVFGSVPAEVAYLTTLYSWVSLRFEEQVVFFIT